MIEESTIGSNLSRKANLLMAELLALANRVLPLDLAAKVQVRAWSEYIRFRLTCFADYPGRFLQSY